MSASRTKEVGLETAGPKGIPPIGLGTWKLRGRSCVDRVSEALALGYRHIDTAQMYENEADVGRGIRESESETSREDVFLTTKLWSDNLEREDVRTSTEGSLRRLGTDHVDLLLIHWPNAEVPIEETLGAMLRLREEGMVRRLGVSNFTPALWRRALEVAPVEVNEVEYHPYLDQSALLTLAEERDLALIAYSPLARGKVAEDPTLGRIGEDHGKSAAQVALRWLLQQERVAAIPKAGSSKHLRENARVFDFELGEDEMSRIASLRGSDREVDPSWAPWNRGQAWG